MGAASDHRQPPGPRAVRSALVDSVGGVGRPLSRRVAPRHLPARRALRARRRPGHRGQGDQGGDRARRVRVAALAAPPRHALGRAVRHHQRAQGRRRHAAGRLPPDPAPGVLPSVPGAVQPAPAPRHRQAAPRRPRRAARAAPPGGLLVGRRLAVEHAVPARCRLLHRLPRRCGDGSAATRAEQRPAHPRPRHRPRQHRR